MITKNNRFIIYLFVVIFISGCSTLSKKEKSDSSQELKMSISMSPIYQGYVDWNLYDSGEEIIVTEIESSVGPTGAGVFFNIENKSNETVYLEDIYLNIDSIMLDVSGHLIMRYHTDSKGNLFVTPYNAGWDTIGGGKLTLYIPQNAGHYFSSMFFDALIEPIESGESHKSIKVIDSSFVAFFPETPLRFPISWTLETDQSRFINSYTGRGGDIVVDIGPDGMIGSSGPFGIEDIAAIMVDPECFEKRYVNHQKRAIQAQENIAYFTKIGSNKSCDMDVYFTFVFDNGEIHDCENIKLTVNFPKLNREEQSKILDDPFLGGIMKQPWKIVSNFDKERFVIKSSTPSK